MPEGPRHLRQPLGRPAPPSRVTWLRLRKAQFGVVPTPLSTARSRMPARMRACLFSSRRFWYC